MKIISIIFLVFLFPPAFAQSGVYKKIDESGTVTYSNIRSNKAKQLDLPPINFVPGIDSAAVESKIQKKMQSIQLEEQRNALKNKISEEANRLDELENEYKGGTPDRLGNERMNYQRYLDRVERLESEIAISENNLKTLEAEYQRLPSTK